MLCSISGKASDVIDVWFVANINCAAYTHTTRLCLCLSMVGNALRACDPGQMNVPINDFTVAVHPCGSQLWEPLSFVSSCRTEDTSCAGPNRDRDAPSEPHKPGSSVCHTHTEGSLYARHYCIYTPSVPVLLLSKDNTLGFWAAWNFAFLHDVVVHASLSVSLCLSGTFPCRSLSLSPTSGQMNDSAKSALTA